MQDSGTIGRALDRQASILGCNNNFHAEIRIALAEIALNSTRVSNAAFWVINEANESIARRMFLVPRNVFNKLSSQFLCAESLTSFLDFDHHLFSWQEKVHSSRLASITRCPLFRSHILEKYPKQRMHKVLNVIFIANIQSRSLLASFPNRSRPALIPAKFLIIGICRRHL